MKLKKTDKYFLAGMLLVALSKLPNLDQQVFSIRAVFGFIVEGALVGLIIYVIFGRNKKKITK